MTPITAAAPTTQTANAETRLRFMALRFYRGWASVSARFLGEKILRRGRRTAIAPGLGQGTGRRPARQSDAPPRSGIESAGMPRILRLGESASRKEPPFMEAVVMHVRA